MNAGIRAFAALQFTNSTRFIIKNLAVLTAMCVTGTLPFTYTSTAVASNLDDPTNVKWASIRGYTSKQFSKYFKKKKSQGYRIIDIEVDTIKGKPQYSAVWQHNTDGRGWSSLRNLTHKDFSTKWKSFKKKGFRLIDQEAYMLNGKRRYAGVWVENKEKLGWGSFRNVDSKGFSDKFKTYKKKGYRMTDIEAYSSGGKTQYSAIFGKTKKIFSGPNIGI